MICKEKDALNARYKKKQIKKTRVFFTEAHPLLFAAAVGSHFALCGLPGFSDSMTRIVSQQTQTFVASPLMKAKEEGHCRKTTASCVQLSVFILHSQCF